MEDIYKVVVDTNIIWQDNNKYLAYLLNTSIKNLARFIKDNKLSDKVLLAIPELVLQERCEQSIRIINQDVEKVKEIIKNLNEFGFNVPKKYYSKNFRKIIVSQCEDDLLNFSIEILKTPKINQKIVINRVLKRQKPFDNQSDRGFKDTVI
jgi:hypothetical protein